MTDKKYMKRMKELWPKKPEKHSSGSASARGSAASCAMVNVHGSGVCGKPATHKSGHASKPNYWCEHHGIILSNAGYRITRIEPPNEKGQR
jgi:hypothetical protein